MQCISKWIQFCAITHWIFDENVIIRCFVLIDRLNERPSRFMALNIGKDNKINQFIGALFVSMQIESSYAPEFVWWVSLVRHILCCPCLSYLQNWRSCSFDSSGKCTHRCFRPRIARCPRSVHETSPGIYRSKCKTAFRHTVAGTSRTAPVCRAHVYIRCKWIPITPSIRLRWCWRNHHGTNCCTDHNQHKICEGKKKKKNGTNLAKRSNIKCSEVLNIILGIIVWRLTNAVQLLLFLGQMRHFLGFSLHFCLRWNAATCGFASWCWLSRYRFWCSWMFCLFRRLLLGWRNTNSMG